MQEIIGSYNPILIISAFILTIMASYTSMDLVAMHHSSERNRRFLLISGTLSMGVGIWLMNFLGMLAIEAAASFHYHIPLTLLSLLIGISFVAVAFYIVTSRFHKFSLFLASILMTCAVTAVHFVGMLGLRIVFSYNPIILVVAIILMCVSFWFVFWMLFFAKNFSVSHRVWMKPLAALVLTVAIVEGHFLLVKSAAILKFETPHQPSNMQNEQFFIYIVLFLSVVLLLGLISSSAFISKRLAISVTSLKDISAALDESSIVAITDPNGKITFVNDKFVEISKYPRSELIGNDHSILNSGYHSRSYFKQLWKEIRSGKVWKGEIRNRAKDGSYYWVDTTIVPFLDKNGKPYQYVAIRHDITKRRLAEEQLKDSLKEVNDINFALDQSSIVAFTDSKGKITKVNDKFCEISKYSREELIGEDHRILNSGLHSNTFFKELWRTIATGQVWKGEIRNKAKDGTYYWVDTTIIPFMDEQGKPYQYLAIRNDITERKKTEETLHRQDKLAAVGQLAAGVAHEIRNPLTSMKGYGEFLLEDEIDPQRKEFIEIILDEISRVNMIVEDFMVLAKPKAATLEERNIVTIIRNVLSLLDFEARKKNVKMSFESNEEIIQIECDEDRLKQVFLNFVKNGIEAMPNGGELTVKVSIENNQVQISIQDTGVGIPEDKLKKIGEPFYTTKKEGNGLGLMVSFKIIESHHGKVYIESELNKGTTFNIVLPAKTA